MIQIKAAHGRAAAYQQAAVHRSFSQIKLADREEICIRLQIAKRVRELALFNLAIDSKLRGCDPNRIARTANDRLYGWGGVSGFLLQQ